MVLNNNEKYLSEDDYFFQDVPEEIEYKTPMVKIIDESDREWYNPFYSCNIPCKEFVNDSIRCLGCNICVMLGCAFMVANCFVPNYRKLDE